MSKQKQPLSLSDACYEDGSDHQAHLAKIVDEHVAWLMAWHRLAFFSAVTQTQSIDAAQKLPIPKAFVTWFKGPAQRLPTEQQAIDRLAILHDQLHKLARMLLLKAEGRPLSATDYELVMGRYLDFITSLRAFERRFSAAVAGLDTLTGLHSRFIVCDDLAAEQKRMARAKDHNQSFCVALVDIDQFRTFNQLHGEETGDKALVQTAEQIRAVLRAYDEAYRVGADEFLICLKGTDKDSAFTVMERLRRAIVDSKIRLFGGGQQEVTLSIGLVEAKADEKIPFLLYRAEQALAGAKQAGGNVVQHGSTARVQLM